MNLTSVLAMTEIEKYLALAQEEAQKALAYNEIPIGAVIVQNNIVIGRGFNQTLMSNDITKHAEIIAIQEASRNINNHRLVDCDLYVTLEPCVMCIGAIIHSRIKRVIFGTLSPKAGAIISQFKLLANREVNHHTEAIGPIPGKNYISLLQDFLRNKR